MSRSAMRCVGGCALIALGVGVAVGGGINEARAQCVEQWQPFDSATAGYSGLNSVHCATVWDPDGPGPVRERIVLGGGFQIAGDVVSRRVVAFDPILRRWIPMGTNILGGVWDVKALPSGELYAVASSPVGVWRWNGMDWTALPPLSNASNLYAVEVTDAGEVIVGGQFGLTTTPRNVAKFSNGSWSGLGDVGMVVFDLKVRSNGAIVACGRAGTFDPIGFVKEWNGTEWITIGAGDTQDGIDGSIRSVDELPNGDLVVAGTFRSLNGTICGNAARWDGATWHPMPIGTSQFPGVADVAVTPNGEIYAAYFQTYDQSQMTLMRWNGEEWVPDGDLFRGVASQIVPVGEDSVLAVGRINEASGQRVVNAAMRTGSEWSPLDESLIEDLPTSMTSILRLDDGAIVFAGPMSAPVSGPVRPVWRNQDGVWTPLTPGPASVVKTLYQSPGGALIAGGLSGVYQWVDSGWSRLGNSVSGEVNAVSIGEDGSLIVGGGFTHTNASGVTVQNLATWTGSGWKPMGAGFNAAVTSLARLANGDLVAAGTFTASGSQPLAYIARWDGQQWRSMGNGMNGAVRALHVRDNGDLIAVGDFEIAGSVYSVGTARWANGVWTSMPGLAEGGTIYSIADRENEDLVICGDFGFTGQSARWAARWNGTMWEPLGVTALSGPTATPIPLAIEDDGAGGVVLGGNFDLLNGVVMPRIARLSAKPFVRDEPQSTSVPVGETVELRARPGAGFFGVSVQWLHNGVEVVDGPGGASAGGGTVVGASVAMASPTNDSDAVLTISNARISDSGEYVAVFSSACGQVSTPAATVLVEPLYAGCASCAADYDQSGGVDAGDVAAFFGEFEAGAACADVNLDGGVDGGDIGAFFAVYEAGGC
mgnify:CR=1 FL=1